LQEDLNIEVSPSKLYEQRLNFQFLIFNFSFHFLVNAAEINAELEKIASDDDTDALAEISEDEF